MKLNVYQKKAHRTAIYPKKHGLYYLTLKLNGEAGEIAEKVGKFYRDGKFKRADIARELGDVLWYVQELAGFLGYDLKTIAELNLNKLFDRMRRGKLGGEGDNR